MNIEYSHSIPKSQDFSPHKIHKTDSVDTMELGPIQINTLFNQFFQIISSNASGHFPSIQNLRERVGKIEEEIKHKEMQSQEIDSNYKEFERTIPVILDRMEVLEKGQTELQSILCQHSEGSRDTTMDGMSSKLKIMEEKLDLLNKRLNELEAGEDNGLHDLNEISSLLDEAEGNTHVFSHDLQTIRSQVDKVIKDLEESKDKTGDLEDQKVGLLKKISDINELSISNKSGLDLVEDKIVILDSEISQTSSLIEKIDDEIQDIEDGISVVQMGLENVKEELNAINGLMKVQSDLGEGLSTSVGKGLEYIKSGVAGLGGYVWEKLTKIGTGVVEKIYSIAIYIIFYIFIFFLKIVLVIAGIGVASSYVIQFAWRNIRSTSDYMFAIAAISVSAYAIRYLLLSEKSSN